MKKNKTGGSESRYTPERDGIGNKAIWGEKQTFMLGDLYFWT